MKILIVSTPKTGNTWLKTLLGTIYNLPLKTVGRSPDEPDLDHLGDDWVCHEHYYPTADLIAWAEHRSAILITTIRHPADVLVSMTHHSKHYSTNEYLDRAVKLDGGEFGPNVVSYVAQGFFIVINLSIAWLHTGLSHVVRYEDLLHDGLRALTELTDMIEPVTPDRIACALSACGFENMRQSASDQGKNFFRKGQSGDWRNALPQSAKEILIHSEPYPTQLARLGYSLEDGSLRATVANPSNDWANQRSPNDPLGHMGVPIITNLGAQLHAAHPDKEVLFPDLFGAHRVDFSEYFLNTVTFDPRYGSAFTIPVALSWAREK
jgi:hypothetical protein